MALNQIWISANGTDTASGTTYALAKKTLAGGISTWVTSATTTYNVLNIVNDGTHAMATGSEVTGTNDCVLVYAADKFLGTSYSGTNFGFVIQGVDPSGDPAMTTLAATATRFSGVCGLRGVFGGGTQFMQYGTFKGLVFDFTAVSTDTDTLYGINQYYTGCCPLRVQDCEVIGAAIGGAAPRGRRVICQTTSIPAVTLMPEGYETSYCMFTNTRYGLLPYGEDYQISDNHHNVFIWNTDNTTPMRGGVISLKVGAEYEDFSVTHSTFYMVTSKSSDVVLPLIDINSSSSTDLTVHSNLVYVQPASDAAVTAPIPDALFNGAAKLGSTRGDMGYNYFALGTHVSQLTSWTAGGFYNDSYLHPDWPTPTGTFTATFSGDNVTTQTALESVFNETTTSWTWTSPSGNGYSHTLPFDMRPIVGRAASLTGGVVGAVTNDIITPVTPGVGGGIEYDAVVDSLPFYRPTFKADVATMVRVRRNDTFSHVDMRHYLKSDQFDESTHRIVEVAAAGRYEGSLGGVAASTAFMLETDVTVSVSVVWVNGTTDTVFGMEVSEVAVFDQAGIKSFVVNNTSSATATVQMISFQ